MVNLVTRDARQTANEIQDQLEARDIQGLGLMAVAGAAGVILAQEVTERVLPLLSMPSEPSTAVQFVAAGAVKIALALVIGFIGASMGGLPLVILAFSAVGSTVFAGADFWNAIQRSGFLAEAPRGTPQQSSSPGGSGNSQRPSRGSVGNASISADGSLFDAVA